MRERYAVKTGEWTRKNYLRAQGKSFRVGTRGLVLTALAGLLLAGAAMLVLLFFFLPAASRGPYLIRLGVLAGILLLAVEFLYRRSRGLHDRTLDVCSVYDREGLHALSIGKRCREIAVWEFPDGFYATGRCGELRLVEYVPWGALQEGTPEEFREFVRSRPNYAYNLAGKFPWWLKALGFAVAWTAVVVGASLLGL